MDPDLRREIRLLVRIGKRAALLAATVFGLVTVLPLNPSRYADVSGATWVGDSVSVHVLRWLEGHLLPPQEQILVLGPFDAFTVIMQMGFYLTLMFLIPYLAVEMVRYFIGGRFGGDEVPGVLRESQRRLLYGLSGLTTGLFGAGVAFATFVVLPPLYAFSYSLQPAVGGVGSVSLDGFIGTTFAFALGLGLAFEIPAVCFGLALIHVLKSSTMRVYWRHAVFGCVVVAFLISPGVGGGIVELGIASILSGLYGVSYWLVRRVERVAPKAVGTEQGHQSAA